MGGRLGPSLSLLQLLGAVRGVLLPLLPLSLPVRSQASCVGRSVTSYVGRPPPVRSLINVVVGVRLLALVLV